VINWGVLPEVVRGRLRQLEWDNLVNLRDRLLRERPFPIRVMLKPPTGRQALEAMPHFQAYMAAWRAWPGPGRVEYETSSLTQVGRHELPAALVLDRFEDLAGFLGPDAQARQRHWDAVMAPLCAIGSTLYPALIRNLATVEALSEADARKLAKTLTQLRKGLGAGNYTRALPLIGVDTKFVEQNSALLTELADSMHEGAIARAGGLFAWLDCRPPPRDWLYVRLLCPEGCRRCGGFDLMQLSTPTLRSTPLPADRVLIVENLAAGYALPEMPCTIAVFGGGANVQWTDAPWLAERQVGYWGDIDTWGFHYLASVRVSQPHVHPILMNLSTVEAHRASMIDEKEPNPVIPAQLDPEEERLYQDLLSRRHGGSCLEQERLSMDWVHTALSQWQLR
jgi:hypothetical protein